MYIVMNVLQKYDSAVNSVVIIRLAPHYHLLSIKPLTCDFMYLSIRSARALISDFGSYIIPTLGSSRESTTICKNNNCRMTKSKVNCIIKRPWILRIYRSTLICKSIKDTIKVFISMKLLQFS
jgi:hypothetical protein